MCKLCQHPELFEDVKRMASNAFRLIDRAGGGLEIEAHPASDGTVKMLMVVRVSEGNVTALHDALAPFLEETAMHEEARDSGARLARPGRA